MPNQKRNCWEYNNCGREPGGSKAAELGVCVAATDESFDKINSGKNAGRICWAVAGTFCGGKVQGTFAEKRKSCTSCDFYKLVRDEEGKHCPARKFLKFIADTGKSAVFDKMVFRQIKAGERFVTQGASEDTAYIIQNGSCLAIVEKDGVSYPAAHYGEGDIVGGLGILTGEPRRAHVEAETDMGVWILNKSQFEDISQESPDVLNFITEVVADRFDSRRPIAYRTIGKYIATDIIGKGGFSIVYKGIHSRLNMPVVIKMMRHNMAVIPDFMRNFLNEANIIANLRHENIIRVYDIEERYKTVFIVMEYNEGQILTDMIAHLKVLPPHLVTRFLIRICSALEYAHSMGIIHRDINPSNIMIERNHRLKLFDFGLACPVGTEDFGTTGTAFYMSPEQIEGDPVDARTDIYALGITAYEMLTGQRPFPEDDLKTLLDIHLKQDVPDPAAKHPHLDRVLRQFVLKAGRRDPAQRYQTAAEALEDLLPLAEKYGENPKWHLPDKSRKTTSIFMTYPEDRQIELGRLISEFTAKAKELGIETKMADFRDVE